VIGLEPSALRRLYARARAARWDLDPAAFTRALEAAADRLTEGSGGAPAGLERALGSLHLEDLALACACAAGHDAAWDHLMTSHRPALYRAADRLDPTGGARELADALWAELYGVRGRTPDRLSLLHSFQGRSSLATWLRSVLAQRHVDRLRVTRRERPLPDDDAPAALSSPRRPEEPERPRYVALMREGLARAVADLAPRDRLRLRCYYAEGLTLAEIGRLLGEHEATVSRGLARARAAIRTAVERFLSADARLDPAQVAACFASVSADAGPLDLGDLFGDRDERKKPASGRSEEEQTR